MQAPKTECAGSIPAPDSTLCRGSSVVEHLLEANRLQGSQHPSVMPHKPDGFDDHQSGLGLGYKSGPN